MKTVHIISHSHWDREWYLPYERHHMLLVELIDDVLELFETDPGFKSYFLDGQTIILDDYLEVRPEKEELLRKYIDNGQLKIGPFYILQDAYLTSSESNVRNMLVGHQETQKWGATTEIGYYPDTFGNAGQTPQLMDQLGFDIAAFGRGVKPTGFANVSDEEDNFVSSYSEMNWEGIDGTEIIGLLFANWYCNGNEVPTDRVEAKEFWDKSLQDVENYASTNQLLMLNGCDHQPVQKDLAEAIRVANELYPEYNFIHSNFTTYMRDMIEELPEELDTVSGELTSQETEGWYTLTNTASSRMYLKQENTKIAKMLENIAEPLASLAYEVTGEYPHDILDYAWKVYMQNHPHDSICGCSVDEVHEEMMTRYQKAENVAQYVIDESLESITSNIDTETNAPENGHPFVVFNTAGIEKTSAVNVTIEMDHIYFQELFPTKAYNKLKAEELSNFKVVDGAGKEVLSEITIEEPAFNYELPKDTFRQPYMAQNINVGLYVENMPAFSWETFYLVPTTEAAEEVAVSEELSLENDFIKVDLKDNGTLQVTDKVHDKVYDDLLVYEDRGDIGNEYVYKQPNGEEPILSIDRLKDAKVVIDNDFQKTLELTHEIEVPVSADEQLDLEQRTVVEFRNRTAQRVSETKPLAITTIVTLEKEAKHVSFQTKLKNEMKDHRLRVLFPTALSSDIHYADSIYETVERPNEVSDVWTNPENAQRTHRFIQVSDEKNGMLLEPEGLNEYEVLMDEEELTIALTLFRSIGEMGDWGYFPTPGAQCFEREFEFVYYLSFHGEDDMEEARKQSIHRQIPLSVQQVDKHEGTLDAKGQYLNVEGETIAVTALKRQRGTDDLITRFYNFSDEASDFTAEHGDLKPVKSNILEEKEEPLDAFKAKAFEIVTLKWKKGD